MQSFLFSSQVSFSDDNSVYMNMLTCLAACLLQIFVICYFGNELTSCSEKLSLGFFHSEWIIQDKEFKKAMKLFMENAKKPLTIKVGLGVFKVDLPTFLWICNSAYTMYNVLKSLK
jgi:7tm Odorant receptor